MQVTLQLAAAIPKTELRKAAVLRVPLGFILTILILISLSLASSADVISGFGILIDRGWDFSEQVSKGFTDAGADMGVIIVVDPPLGLMAACYRSPAVIAMLPDSSFADLKYAPADTSLYGMDAPAMLNTTYVVRTMERHFAKFRFVQLSYYGTVEIEFVYQPDGTRTLYDVIGVKSYTWGAIKNLYR